MRVGVLERKGIKSWTAANVNEALSMLTTSNVSFIVCDLRVPKTDRRDPGALASLLPNPPHVVYTAAIDPAPNGVGAAHFLPKPFTRHELRRTVNGLLDQ
jgi:CheY-like chemotaxis protein